MNGFGNWWRQFSTRMGQRLRGFMAGRYGTDKLNMAILGTGVVLCLVSMLFQMPWINLLMTLLSYALLFWALFRTMSRNTYKRYRENRRFLLFFDKLKDREHRYYDCPRCHQSVRVPRGKGKIAITCPKCHEKFVRKT